MPSNAKLFILPGQRLRMEINYQLSTCVFSPTFDSFGCGGKTQSETP